MTTLLEAPKLPLTYVAPRYHHVPDTKVGDFGDEITDMMGLMGRQLDPEQQQDVADLSSFDAQGKWVALESGVKESRQNGKTAATVLPVALFDLFHLPPDRVCWTAHRFKTAYGTFVDVDKLLQSAPEYSRQVRRINRSHGEEGFYLKNGASLEFLARESVGSGRGLGGKRNIFDEALILSGGLIGSLLPTMSARSGQGLGPHVNYASSAGMATDKSVHLRELTKRGRYATGSDRIIWIERCAPGGWGTNACDLGEECPHDGRLGCRYPLCGLGIDCPHTVDAPDCALDNLGYIQQANHTLGGRISVQYVLDERRAMHAIPREFGRERLGWDEDPPNIGAGSGVDLEKFAALGNERLMPPGLNDQVVIVVDMPPDRSEVNVWLAWEATDAETLETRPAVMGHVLRAARGDGKEGLLKRALDFIAGLEGNDEDQGLAGKADLVEIVVQAGGPAGSMIAPLNTRGRDAWPSWEVTELAVQQVGQATGHWLDSVRDATFWHLGQEELLKAQRDATLRKTGDALMWAREPGGNISSLMGATLALHRLHTEGNVGPNVW